MKRPENDKGLGAATPKPLTVTHKATAPRAYPSRKHSGKHESGHRCAKVASAANGRAQPQKTAYIDSERRIWRYKGKRARVLEMLVQSSNGLTQHDCLPWHTRFGGTIHAMREDGLSITTELEGKYRHARYRLTTAGSLTIQGKNREGVQ